MRCSWFRAVCPVLALLALCLSMPGNGSAQVMPDRKGEDFTATEIHVADGERGTAKLYVSGGKVRREMYDVVTIGRKDKMVVWVILPSEKSYFETKFDPSQFPMTVQELEKIVARKELGREKVSGYDCVKYQVTTETTTPTQGQASRQGAPRKTTSTVWISDALGAALKVQSDEGFSMEMTNIKIGPLQASLFEPPNGYSKMNLTPMMQQMMSPGMTPGKGKGKAGLP